MEKLTKENFDLNKVATDLNSKFKNAEIIHKTLGKGTIEDFFATNEYIRIRINFENQVIKTLNWEICMEKNLLEENPTLNSMRAIYENVSSIKKELEADRRFKAQKEREERQRTAEERHFQAEYDFYAQTDINLAGFYLKDAEENKHCYDNEACWIKENIPYITAQVPDYLDEWFRSKFPDASYTVVDSRKQFDAGYKTNKWFLTLSARIKNPDAAPTSIRYLIKRNKITDSYFLVNIALNYGIKIGK